MDLKNPKKGEFMRSKYTFIMVIILVCFATETVQPNDKIDKSLGISWLKFRTCEGEKISLSESSKNILNTEKNKSGLECILFSEFDLNNDTKNDLIIVLNACGRDGCLTKIFLKKNNEEYTIALSMYTHIAQINLELKEYKKAGITSNGDFVLVGEGMYLVGRLNKSGKLIGTKKIKY